MNHEQAFLSAINENPLDLINYHVYSDWLIDQRREDEAKRQRNRIKFIGWMWQEAQERKYLRKFPCVPLPCQWTIDEAKKKLKVPMQVCWNRVSNPGINEPNPPWWFTQCNHFKRLTYFSEEMKIERDYYSKVELSVSKFYCRDNITVRNGYVWLGQCLECLTIFFSEYFPLIFQQYTDNVLPVEEFK